jgi:hypothetical protein
MSNKKHTQSKKNSPSFASDPIPRVDLANKEKGIETIYLNDEHKH